jgi:hypothetical protein
MSFWEFYYEINRDCFPSFLRDFEGLELAEGPVSLCFGPKAEIAGAAVLTYISRHLWPPVGSRDEFECLPPSWVSGDAGIMVLGNDSALEFGVLRYVDPVSEKN